tara:strand:+ start:453 stop:1172 length:720 start_codon:yes stop_codon:yes gene_type:complete
MPKKDFNRILIKLSGESLMGKEKYGIELKTVERLASDLINLKKLNIQICIVIGGGNIFRGLAASAKGMDRANADYMGMLATVMNSIALQNSLEKLGTDTRVMSAFPMQSICETYVRRRAMRHMDKKRIVICAAGTGNPYFSTDTAAALRAAELNCNVIYKATQVDGIYDKDPKKFKKIKRIKVISYSEFLEKNLKVIDSAAVSIARENVIPIKIFSILKKNCFKNVYYNKSIYSEIKDV